MVAFALSEHWLEEEEFDEEEKEAFVLKVRFNFGFRFECRLLVWFGMFLFPSPRRRKRSCKWRICFFVRETGEIHERFSHEKRYWLILSNLLSMVCVPILLHLSYR